MPSFLCYYESFGKRDADIALENYGKQIAEYAQNGQLKYDRDSANIVLNENEGKPYSKHTYFGGICE